MLVARPDPRFPGLLQASTRVREFTWNGIKQQNRNGLLARDPSVDGIKTGHTESAGYCLASSAKRGDMRLISVVLGTQASRRAKTPAPHCSTTASPSSRP